MKFKVLNDFFQLRIAGRDRKGVWLLSCVVCCMHKTSSGAFSIPVSFIFYTLNYTFLLLSSLKCLSDFIQLLFIFLLSFRVSCSCYLLKKHRHSQNHSAYKAFQVLVLFVYVTRNTADVATWYISSLMPICVKTVFHILREFN